MAIAKLELFDRELQEAAVLFKALGHPARLAILKFLIETNSCFTGDISTIVPLGRTTVNQHLAELKKAGLIQGHITGIKTKYCISTENVSVLRKVIEQLIRDFDKMDNFQCD